MTKRVKTMDVGTVTDAELGMSVALHLDRDTMTFWAAYLGTRYESKTAEGIDTQVRAAMRASTEVNWQGILRIRPATERISNQVIKNVLGFEVDRLWVARLAKEGGTTYRACRWSGLTEVDDKRLAWSQGFEWNEERDGVFAPPCEYRSYGEYCYYLPHSEDWYTLLYRIGQDELPTFHPVFYQALLSQDFAWVDHFYGELVRMHRLAQEAQSGR